MKDKTDAMNGVSAEMLSEGYESAGKPESFDQKAARRIKTVFHNKALEEYENLKEMGWDVEGGFLRRTDPTDRI